MDKILPGADEWMQDNPGVATAWAAGMMSPAASNFANGLTNAAALQQKNGSISQRAKYLLDHGYASTPEEAHTLASDPALMAATFKDNTYADMVATRAKLAPLLGIDQNDPRYAQFVGAGSFDTSQSNSPLQMTPAERLKLYVQSGGDPHSAEARRYALTGGLDSASSRGLNSTELKIKTADENALPVLENSRSVLAEAKDLLGSGKVHTGMGSTMRAKLAAGLGPDYGGDYIEAPDEVAATQRYNDIANSEAIKTMSAELKGATTDKEMGRYIDIFADESKPVEVRQRALDVVLQRIDREYQIRTDRIKQLSGAEDGDMGGGTIPPPADGGADGVVDFREYFKGP